MIFCLLGLTWGGRSVNLGHSWVVTGCVRWMPGGIAPPSLDLVSVQDCTWSGHMTLPVFIIPLQRISSNDALLWQKSPTILQLRLTNVTSLQLIGCWCHCGWICSDEWMNLVVSTCSLPKWRGRDSNPWLDSGKNLAKTCVDHYTTAPPLEVPWKRHPVPSKMCTRSFLYGSEIFNDILCGLLPRVCTWFQWFPRYS